MKEINYVGKKVGDYTIINKSRVNNRMKYFIRCDICGIEKWAYNITNLKHGSFCEGCNRKTGSSKIGCIYGDYIVLEKLIINNRSAYKVKCTICDSIKIVYNLKSEKHNESCSNFLIYITDLVMGDYKIIRAYREERIYVDINCLTCGAIRVHVAYKNLKLTFRNKHGKICTVKKNEMFSHKGIVKKLLASYGNINSRIRLDKSYKDVKNLFIDGFQVIECLYDEFLYRHTVEGIPLNKLSIDRINPFGNYEPTNVRCLTLTEQQYNKKKHYLEKKQQW